MKDLAPHIHAGETVSGMMGKAVGILLPAVIVSLIFFQLDALWIILVSLAAALLAEVLGGKLLKVRMAPGDGSTVFTALLYALLLPVDTALWMVALGAFFAIFIGKMAYGGLGSNLFNPALIGRIFLQISFPHAMNWPAIIEMAHTPNVFLIVLAASGFLLLWLKLGDWERVCFYFTAGLIFSVVLKLGPDFFLASSLTYLIAFFVITDPVTTPMTKKAAIIFSVFAAAITLFLKSHGANYLQASIYSILIMNAATPWLDTWFAKRPAKVKS